jgi:hypothetical protein
MADDERKEKRRMVQRAWYLRHREDHNQKALDRYYAKHEENKTVARDRARRQREQLVELQKKVAELESPASKPCPQQASDVEGVNGTPE